MQGYLADIRAPTWPSSHTAMQWNVILRLPNTHRISYLSHIMNESWHTDMWSLFLKCFYPHLRTFFSLLWERERESERHWCERETSIGWLLLCATTRDWTCNLGMCSDWQLNPWPFSLQEDAPTNWATPARAMISILKNNIRKPLVDLIFISRPQNDS